MIFGGEQALLDRQLANGQFEDFEVGNLIDHRRRRMVVAAMLMVVAVVFTFLCHVLLQRLWPCFTQSAASSQKSGYSL